MKNAILILLLATPFCLQSQSTPKNNPGQEEAGRPGCGREQGRKHCPPAFFTEQGQVYILAGIGLLPTYIADKPRTDIPPIHLGIRWMATNNFSLGAHAGYSRSWSGNRQVCGPIWGSWFNQTYFIGIENGFHYTRAANWDLYGGLSLLYQHVEVASSNPNVKNAIQSGCFRRPKGRMAMTAYLGARHALSSRYSVFGELGYGVSLLKVGVGYRVM